MDVLLVTFASHGQAGQQIPAPYCEARSVSNEFRCIECGEIFRSAKGLEIHFQKRHETSPKLFSCSACSKSFRSSGLLSIHFKQVHQKATRVLCVKCPRYFCNKFVLQKHLKKYHQPVVSIS